MLSGFVLYILTIFVATTSSFGLYDDTPEEREGKTATPTPIMRKGSLDLGLQRDRNSIRHSQFLLHNGDDYKEPIFVRTAEDVLRNKLLVLLRQSMKDLQYNMKYLEQLYTENKSLMADVSDVVDFVNESYRDLAVIYNNIDKHQRAVHPVKILRAYNKLRKSNLVVRTLLQMYSGGRLADHNTGLPPWADKIGDKGQSMGIAWSYYDDALM